MLLIAIACAFSACTAIPITPLIVIVLLLCAVDAGARGVPRAHGAVECHADARDTIRNMVTTPFMMNARGPRAGWKARDKPFSDNRKIVPEIVFQTCLNGI